MDIIILDQETINGYQNIEMQCGNKTASIGYGKSGAISTLCKNASHKAYRGMGRSFWSWGDAIEAYKNSEMRAMIKHAQEVLQ